MSTITRYVPPLLWGKSGHLQTIIYGKMGRMNTPFPKGERKRVVMDDGATMSYDVFEPLKEHESGGACFFKLIFIIIYKDIRLT